MVNINLLPSDLGPKASAIRIAKLIKKFFVALISLFLIYAFFVIALIIVLKVQVASSNSRQEQLKTSILSLEKTEQSLFLLKDRIGKIKTVFASSSSENNLGGVGKILNNSSGVLMSDVKILPGKVNLTVMSVSAAPLGDFLEKIVTGNDYQTVKVKSLSFNPSSGYLVSLELTQK